MIYCASCKRYVNSKYVSAALIRKDGTARRCKSCNWIFARKGIPYIDNFSENEIRLSIDFLLFKESSYLNDLAEKLNRSLDDIIYLVKTLKVGNRHYTVRSHCSCCGCEIENPVSVYLQYNNLYCSKACYWNHKSKTLAHGKDSKFYNRIQTACTNCGKEINVTPFKFNETNHSGDNHNFCCQKCYWEFRKKYYVGEKASRYNSIMTPEHLEKLKRCAFERSRSSGRFNTKIQRIVNQILDKHGIEYEREHVIRFYSVDNYLIDSGLIIEVMGDYWHASPLKYNENMYLLNSTQQRGILTDKQKKTYIRTHCGVNILYLWENDIENHIELCENLILKYIEKNGILENYHSFNWIYEDKELKLKDLVITPYQDMKADEYRHLIKQKAG